MVPTWRLGEHPWLDERPPASEGRSRPSRRGDRPGPGVRVVVDNDFAGDPDDCFQLAHHLLSPAVEIRTVIGSHLRPGDPAHPGPGSAAAAVRRARHLLQIMELDAESAVLQGAEDQLADRSTPRPSAAAEAIIAEARRDDPRPLFVAVGGGLTDLASAWLMEPSIAERMTVIWIGGPEYPGLGHPPPGPGGAEYNLAIDPIAAQVVFNDSDLPLWQVPRDVYRQCMVSDMELRERVAPAGPLGRFLYEEIREVSRLMGREGHGYAETYSLGDSPLVLLTALQSRYQPDPSSSAYVVRPAPEFDAEGNLAERADGRPIRVYTRVDTRLMFEDLFLKLAVFERWRSS